MYRFHDRTVSARYHMESSKMVLLIIHDLLFLPHLAVVFRLLGTMAVTSSRSCENNGQIWGQCYKSRFKKTLRDCMACHFSQPDSANRLSLSALLRCYQRGTGYCAYRVCGYWRQAGMECWSTSVRVLAYAQRAIKDRDAKSERISHVSPRIPVIL
jgi:hypothetical protein